MSREAFGVALGLALLFGTAAAAMAHEGDGDETLAVEPSNVTAGDSVVLAGSGLEPDDDRVLLLAGGDLIVEFGSVRTDAEGMFQKELTIPDHLPSGTYELRAVGDETLTAPLGVTAAVGSAAEPTGAAEAVVPRERTALELGLILVFVAGSAAVGGLVVSRAERLPAVSGG